MGNFSKLGAIAMAFALSVMFMTPTTVKAYQAHDYSHGTTSVIDSNVTTVKVSGSAPCYDAAGKYDKDARSKASINAWLAATQKGIATVGSAYNYYTYFGVTNPTTSEDEYTYFSLNEAYRCSSTSDTTGSGKDLTVNVYLTFTKTEYKNSITGEKSYSSKDLTGSTKYVGDNSIPTKATVYTGDYESIYVYLGSGNVNIKHLKSSNKKAVQVKSFVEETIRTSSYYDIRKDSQGYYYEPDRGADKVYVSGPDVKVNRSRSVIMLRVFGKKTGKSVISFDIVNTEGVKTGSAKITVVSNTSKPIDKITLGGKSLDQGDTVGTADSNYIYNKKNVNTYYRYTTMKNGKLKVTPNKDYKLVRIQVGHLEKYKYDSSTDPEFGDTNYTTSDVTKTDRTHIETTSSHKADLNGDGDYDDVVNGISESSVLYRYKTVKNNSKIKLSKTPQYTKETSSNSTTYSNSNASENSYYSRTDNSKGGCLAAPTSIRITLYNKITKDYEYVQYVVWKKIK